MAGRRPDNFGPVGERVATGVTVLRLRHGWSLAQLADRLADYGRPMGRAAVHCAESGMRRVDADDLVAFAAVLGVTPTLLLSGVTQECRVCAGSPPPGYACVSCGAARAVS